MKLTIESTTKIVELDGLPCRVWEGQTDSGIPVHCFVTRVAVANDQLTIGTIAQFERELIEQRRPTPETETLLLRLIL